MDCWNTSFLLGWPIFQGLFSFRERISLTIFAASILCRDFRLRGFLVASFSGGDMLISQEEFEACIAHNSPACGAEVYPEKHSP